MSLLRGAKKFFFSFLHIVFLFSGQKTENLMDLAVPRGSVISVGALLKQYGWHEKLPPELQKLKFSRFFFSTFKIRTLLWSFQGERSPHNLMRANRFKTTFGKEVVLDNFLSKFYFIFSPSTSIHACCMPKYLRGRDRHARLRLTWSYSAGGC